ncbi:MAG: HEAT repeat domain-containing protein [Candidatus Brocadiia bacterium]
MPNRNAWGIVHIVGRAGKRDGVKFDPASDGLLYVGSTGSHAMTATRSLHLDGHEGLKIVAGPAAILFRYVVGNAPAFGRCSECGRDIRTQWFSLDYTATAHLPLAEVEEPDDETLLFEVRMRYSCPALHSSSTTIRILEGGASEAPAPPRQWSGKLEPSDYLLLGTWLSSRSKMLVDPEAGAAAAAKAIEQLGSQDPLLRINAVRALGAWKAEGAVGPLIELLRGAGPHLQRHVVTALGEVGSNEATPALLRLLSEGDKELRLHVVRAMETIADPRAADALAALVQGGYPESDAAGKALRAIGEPAVPPLLGLLSHENWKVRRDTCNVLKQIPAPETVPAIARLLRDPNYTVRATAAHALRRYGDLRAVGPLLETMCAEGQDRSGSQQALAQLLREHEDAGLEPVAKVFLEDTRPAVRERAWYVLACVGPRAIEAFLAGLASDVPEARRLAAKGLRSIALDHPPRRGKPVSPAMMKLLRALKKGLEDKNAAVRTEARTALANLRTPLPDPWRKELLPVAGEIARQLENLNDRVGAKVVLGDLGPPAQEVFFKVLKTGSLQARAAAAEGLGKAGDARAIGPLLDSLKTEEDWLRRRATKTIDILSSRLKDQAVPPLAACLKTVETPRIRAAAARALRWTLTKESRQGLEPLLDALSDEAPEVRAAAAETLGRVGILSWKRKLVQSAVEPLLARLADDAPSVRANAAKSLGAIKEPRAVAPLVKARTDPAAEVRAAAAEAMGRMDGPEAFNAILIALTDREGAVRASAVAALKRKKDTRVVGLLCGALSDPAPHVRLAAAQALRSKTGYPRPSGLVRWTGGERAVTKLLTALDDPNDRVRMAVAEVLGRLPDRRALQPLMAHLGDPSDYARERIVGAIKAIAGRDAPDLFIKALSHKDDAARKEALSQLRRMGSWEDRLDCGTDPAKWRQWLEEKRRAEEDKDRGR